MQRERIKAAALAGIEVQARREDRAQGRAARDIGAVCLGVIEARATELEEVHRRGDHQHHREQDVDAIGSGDSTQGSYLLPMRCEPQGRCVSY